MGNRNQLLGFVCARNPPVGMSHTLLVETRRGGTATVVYVRIFRGDTVSGIGVHRPGLLWGLAGCRPLAVLLDYRDHRVAIGWRHGDLRTAGQKRPIRGWGGRRG